MFDASAKPTSNTNSVNDCMCTGPPLQLLVWDILMQARMAPQLILADIQKTFLQIWLKEEDRDAFRFLFNINGIEEQFRFTRIPFGVESSPFTRGATVQHYLDLQPTLEATKVVESAKLPLHKWESNVEALESEDMPNPSKILGLTWDKKEDEMFIWVLE